MSYSSLALATNTYERQMMLYDLFDEYLKSLKEESSKTYQTYINDFKNFFENKDLYEVNVNDIQKFVNYKVKLKLEDVTVYRYYSILKTIFNYAISHEYLQKNPCVGVKVKYAVRSKMRKINYSRRYIRKVSKLFKNTSLYYIVYTALHTRNEKNRTIESSKTRY